MSNCTNKPYISRVTANKADNENCKYSVETTVAKEIIMAIALSSLVS